MANIVINALGIQDSGGITVFEKLLNEIQDSSYKFLIICNQNQNIKKLIKKYKNNKNLEFLVLPSKGFLYRLYYENIVFRKIINEKNIKLMYNFSGSAQLFLQVPQITKVQNLLFYSKKIDEVYFEKKEYLKWFKQIFLKRIVFHTMLKQTKYIEVQSVHVQKNMADFIDVSNKNFYIKSDINFSESEFCKLKECDFSKKILFLYIVGPHFEYLHKNFIDFTATMIELNKMKINFEINITLTKEQLTGSNLWSDSLSEKTNFLGYISDEDEMNKLFCDNTILISTSIIETLGLHVIEAIKNGVISIVPNELYAKSVYGDNILTYELGNTKSLVNTIFGIIRGKINTQKNILTLQSDLKFSESSKEQGIVDILQKVMNVQK